MKTGEDLDPAVRNADILCMTEDTQDEPTKEDLLEEARRKDLEGRSSMKKDELAEALGKTPAKKTGDLTDLAEWRKTGYEGARKADDQK